MHHAPTCAKRRDGATSTAPLMTECMTGPRASCPNVGGRASHAWEGRCDFRLSEKWTSALLTTGECTGHAVDYKYLKDPRSPSESSLFSPASRVALCSPSRPLHSRDSVGVSSSVRSMILTRDP